jgi:hypothetical protein
VRRRRIVSLWPSKFQAMRPGAVWRMRATNIRNEGRRRMAGLRWLLTFSSPGGLSSAQSLASGAGFITSELAKLAVRCSIIRPRRTSTTLAPSREASSTVVYTCCTRRRLAWMRDGARPANRCQTEYRGTCVQFSPHREGLGQARRRPAPFRCRSAPQRSSNRVWARIGEGPRGR